MTSLIIPKQIIKRFKLFLVSIWLRTVLLLLFIALFLLIYVLHDYKLAYSNIYLRANVDYEHLIKKLNFIDYRNFSKLETFFLNEFTSTFFHDYNATYMFLGSLRFIQYRYALHDFCYDKTQTLRFTEDCNPYFYEILSEFTSSTIDPPLDKKYCVQDGCSEFILNGKAKVQASTKWNTNFQDSAFTVDISTRSKEEFMAGIQKIFKNQWIHETKTRVLIVDFNILQEIYENIFKYEIIFEKPAGESNDYVFMTTKKYVVNHYMDQDIVMALFIPLYFVVAMLYLVKTIFLYSYTQNLSLMVDFSFVIVDLNFLISYITEYSEYVKLFGKDLNHSFISEAQTKNAFYNMSSVKIWASYRIFMVFWESIVLFCRVLQLFGTITNFSFYNKFVHSLFRTSPALFKSLFSISFILVGWALGIYVLMRDSNIHFQTFTHTLLSFLALDDADLSNAAIFGQFANSEQEFFYLTCWVLFFLMKFVVFGYFLAIITFSIRKANSFEFESISERDGNITDCVNLMTKKIEKFSKSYLNHLEGEMLTTNKKIIIWLDNNLLSENQYLELANLANRFNINLIPFFEPQQILDFLQFLFRLKPNLMYKSGNLFRILIENKEKNTEFMTYDLNFTKLILDWLRAVGCRVPVCFFMKMNVKENDLMILKKKYPNIVLSLNFDDLVSFCCMTPLSHFVRKIVDKEDSSLVSESEESRLMSKNEEII